MVEVRVKWLGKSRDDTSATMKSSAESALFFYFLLRELLAILQMARRSRDDTPTKMNSIGIIITKSDGIS